MTVKELIEQLSVLDPKAVVILQKDAEGNGYSPLAGGEAGYYVAQNTWSGEFFSNIIDAKEEGEPSKAVVFYPIN